MYINLYPYTHKGCTHMQEYTYEQLVEKTKALYDAKADISNALYLNLNHYIGKYIVQFTLKMRKAGGIEQKPMTRALRTLRTARASINKLKDYLTHATIGDITIPKKKKKKTSKSKTVTIKKKKKPLQKLVMSESEYVTPHPTSAERKALEDREKAIVKVTKKKIKSPKTVKKWKEPINFDYKATKKTMTLDERLDYIKNKVIPKRYW